MTNQEILTKAIQKAIDGGFVLFTHANNWSEYEIVNGDYAKWLIGMRSTPQLIFNHDFAKALWGEGSNGYDRINKNGKAYTDHWQYHLQQMVIADDPIAYLGANS